MKDRFTGHRLDGAQIEAALKVVLDLLKSHEVVSFAYLHGSVLDFQRGEQSILPHDIDVAIYLAEGDWIRVELDLQTEFYRRTGLSPEVLDVHTLNKAPISASMGIIKRGKLMFCRDSLRHADFLESISNSRPQLPMEFAMQAHDRIVIDPDVMFGKPVIRNTRITVEHILRKLAGGMTIEEIIADHPHLEPEDILAAQQFAADYLADEVAVFG